MYSFDEYYKLPISYVSRMYELLEREESRHNENKLLAEQQQGKKDVNRNTGESY